MKGYAEFELDLREVLLERVIAEFKTMEREQLLAPRVDALPDEQGIYQLMFSDRIVYVGKTDAAAGLRRRLHRHAQKILHRTGLHPDEVTFKAIRLFVFTPMDLETALIKHYGKEKGGWNGSGFGSNDPGRERDTTGLKESHFDLLYPIDLDREIYIEFDSAMTPAQALKVLNSFVPYLIRWETAGGKPHTDLSSVKVQLASKTTARRAIAEIVASLPRGWKATGLPGYVILYKEEKSYAHGHVIARSI